MLCLLGWHLSYFPWLGRTLGESPAGAWSSQEGCVMTETQETYLCQTKSTVSWPYVSGYEKRSNFAHKKKTIFQLSAVCKLALNKLCNALCLKLLAAFAPKKCIHELCTHTGDFEKLASKHSRLVPLILYTVHQNDHEQFCFTLFQYLTAYLPPLCINFPALELVGGWDIYKHQHT